MAIFEGFFGKRSSDDLEDQNKADIAGEKQSPAMNQSPQEPILPDRKALEAEASELFVSKPDRAAEKPEQAALSDAEQRNLSRQAEQQASAQEAAMTKARTDVLDILSRIEKAGISIPPELKTQVKDELANLAVEAARVEFQEAERSNPLIELRRIFQEAIDGASQMNLADTRECLAIGLRNLNNEVEKIAGEFQRKKLAILQQGGDAANIESIVSSLLRNSSNFDFSTRFFGQIALYVREAEQGASDELINQLLKELAVFSGGRPVPFFDLIRAVQDSGRRNSKDGLPYRNMDGITIGLTSSNPALNGLFLNTSRNRAGNETQTVFYLFGDKNFWLRVAENAPELQ